MGVQSHAAKVVDGASSGAAVDNAALGEEKKKVKNGEELGARLVHSGDNGPVEGALQVIQLAEERQSLFVRKKGKRAWVEVRERREMERRMFLKPWCCPGLRLARPGR